MAKLEKLSPEQEQKMIEVRDYWLNYIFSCKNKTTRPAAAMAICWLYEFSKIKAPQRILFVDSPMGVQYAISLFKESAKIDNVWANVGDNVWANVRANVGDNVGANVGENVWDNVWENVRENVRENYESFSYYGSIRDYGWVAFYDYFMSVEAIPPHDGFIKFRDLLRCGVYDMVQLQNICIVSGMPNKIVRNAVGRLHNPTGPAITFSDGYCQYYINGRCLPSWIWEKAEAGEITKEMFLKETNSDIKGGIYEVMGQKRMMDMLGAKEIDERQIIHKNGEIETVTLLKTKEKFNEIENKPFAWVKMVCPSTGTQYLQGVEPHHTNALSAIASLSPFSPEEYSFDMRS